MSRARRFIGTTLASCLAIMGTSVLAAPPAPPPPYAPAPQPVAPPADRPVIATPPAATEGPAAAPAENRGVDTFRAKSVLGSKVSIQGGLAIGSVEDIIFDDNGYVDYLVVANDGKYVPVPWEAAKFNFENRTATVEITQDRFKEIPTYTTAQFPTTFYEPAYQTKIYGYYGVTPRQERRIDKGRRP